MIAIIDYNSGNTASVKNALDKLGFSCSVTGNADEILKADGVIFPGVGRASAAMRELHERGQDALIPQIMKPFLGICLGLQLLADFSEEDETECLGVIPGSVRRFAGGLKIPQIGWNKVFVKSASPLFDGVPDESYFYFVNSYYADFRDNFVIGRSFYGEEFDSVISRENFYATQFHPEKSGEVGLRLLRNFCELC